MKHKRLSMIDKWKKCVKRNAFYVKASTPVLNCQFVECLLETRLTECLVRGTENSMGLKGQ